jgi:hypothetical protein
MKLGEGMFPKVAAYLQKNLSTLSPSDYPAAQASFSITGRTAVFPVSALPWVLLSLSAVDRDLMFNLRD